MMITSLSTVRINATWWRCYPGISLNVVTWLKTKHVILFVGGNTLSVGAEEKPPTQILLHKLCTQEGEQFPLVRILEEPSVPVLLWNTGLAIPNPGTWA